MRSHYTAFGVGAGFALLALGAVALFGSHSGGSGANGDGVHIVNFGDGDRGSFRLRDDDLDFDASWTGEFAFAADGRSLTSLDGRLEVTSNVGGVKKNAEFSDKSGVIDTRYEIDDAEQTGEAAATGAADLLQAFARASGVNAQSRIAALLATGGAPAAIDEIEKLTGAHAVGAYVEALAAETTLNSADIIRLAEIVTRIDSDYAKRRAISAMLRAGAHDEAATLALLTIAGTIEGDHELRLLVDEFSQQKFDADGFRIVMALIEQIKDGHEVRLAVGAMLASENIDNAAAARVLDLAAKKIEGDYELRLVVDAAEERLGDDAVAAAAIAALDKIGAAHDRRLAIEGLADALPKSAAVWPALAAATAGIDEDFEKRLAIEAVAEKAPANEECRKALAAAAATIGSDDERKLALETIQ